ncbi:MAG: hypothetical protein K0R50_183 [Eubacterium sp.]|jgi:hypothetical protein|nr:hypothetical protein [Eubacterium sp.]
MKLQHTNTLNFINLINMLPDEEYLLSMVAYGSAPTIREEKPSSLMTFTKAGRNLYDLWKLYSPDVCQKLDLQYTQLRDTKDSVRVLFYKTRLLEECLNRNDCRRFLDSIGYDSSITLDECITILKNRFEHVCPHEIGIFLGIPVEDVVGFINHKGENSLLCRYWKVYHNPEKALKLFKSFDKARQDIRESITNRNYNFMATA